MRYADAADPVQQGEAHHRADQPVLFDGVKVRRIQQVNSHQPHFPARLTRVVQRHLAKAPPANTVMDVALEFGGRGVFRAGQLGQQG